MGERKKRSQLPHGGPLRVGLPGGHAAGYLRHRTRAHPGAWLRLQAPHSRSPRGMAAPAGTALALTPGHGPGVKPPMLAWDTIRVSVKLPRNVDPRRVNVIPRERSRIVAATPPHSRPVGTRGVDTPGRFGLGLSKEGRERHLGRETHQDVHVVSKDGLGVHTHAGATCRPQNALGDERHVTLAELSCPPPRVPRDVRVKSERSMTTTTHETPSPPG